MGQAFDREGNILGEAYGETKREVFEKLHAEFKDAHEIRIRSIEDQISAAEKQAASNSTELPRYRSHKIVHALRIRRVVLMPGGSGVIVPADEGYAAIDVSAAYMDKHDPQAGGYYVVYADGYLSFSPAKAFEEGYTRI